MKEQLGYLLDMVFHPTRTYRLAYLDTLTGCPNHNALRRGIDKLSRGGKSLAVYVADIFGLKTANEAFDHATGNTLLMLGAVLLRQAVSDFGKGRVYREHGDEYVALVSSITEETAEKIPARIVEYCQEINARRKCPFSSSAVGSKPSLTSPVDDMLNRFNLPVSLPVYFHVGHDYSPDGRDILQVLDKSRKIMTGEKVKFYAEHPEWDPRKSAVIASLRISRQ